jgi:hypothetical protein
MNWNQREIQGEFFRVSCWLFKVLQRLKTVFLFPVIEILPKSSIHLKGQSPLLRAGTPRRAFSVSSSGIVRSMVKRLSFVFMDDICVPTRGVYARTSLSTRSIHCEEARTRTVGRCSQNQRKVERSKSKLHLRRLMHSDHCFDSIVQHNDGEDKFQLTVREFQSRLLVRGSHRIWVFCVLTFSVRCISIGTRKGYSVTNCDPFGRVYTMSELSFSFYVFRIRSNKLQMTEREA